MLEILKSKEFLGFIGVMIILMGLIDHQEEYEENLETEKYVYTLYERERKKELILIQD